MSAKRASIKNANASSLSRDETAALVEKVCKKYFQLERERITEMLSEVDKERTQNKVAFETVKHEIYKQAQEMEDKVTESRKKDCEDHRKAMKDAIEDAKPNYWAIIGLVLTVFLPFLGWVYSHECDLWNMKIEYAREHGHSFSGDDRPVPIRKNTPKIIQVEPTVATSTASASSGVE